MTSNRQVLCNWLTRAVAAGFAAAGFAAVVVVAVAGNLCGQEPAARAAGKNLAVWKTGAALRKQLETPISLVWGDREARGAFDSLARGTGVAIFLDRRIDPTRKLTLRVTDEPLRGVLATAAEQVDAGVTLVGSVVYIGPKATSSKLLALANLRRQEAGRLPAEARIRQGKSEAWNWNDLAEPRALLADLAGRGGVRVENPELVPHDLWPAADWPAMSWIERMTLLLAGLDLTYELSGTGTIRLVPLPDEVVFEKTYTPRGDADRAAIDLARLVPEAKIVAEHGVLRVTAGAEGHERIEKLLSGEPVKTAKTTPGQKRYTLTVENKPAGAVLKTIATQLGKELKYDSSVAEKLQSDVSLAVREVPLDQLLRQVLEPLNLAYRLTETALEVTPKP